MQPTSTQSERSSGLDGVRALAALSVFAFHLWLYGAAPGQKEAWGPVLIQFRVGLICFFVLSGYLLYRAFARAAERQRGPVGWGRYLSRRAARILPAYYVSLLAAGVLLEAADGTPGVRMPDHGLPLFAVFAQNYSSNTIMKLNPVTWTLCLEAAFYVLLPVVGLFAYHVARGRRAPQAWMCLALIGVGVGWHAIGFQAGWSQLETKALPAYLPYFALGMLVAIWLERPAGPPLAWRPGRTLLLVAGGLALVGVNGYWHAVSAGPRTDAAIAIVHDLPAGLGFAALIAAAAAGAGPAIAWLRNASVAWIGLVSYGFYLWHVPVILFLRYLGVVEHEFWSMLVLALPLTLAAAAASWYLVERPVLAAVNRRFSPSTAAA